MINSAELVVAPVWLVLRGMPAEQLLQLHGVW